MMAVAMLIVGLYRSLAPAMTEIRPFFYKSGWYLAPAKPDFKFCRIWKTFIK